MRIIDKNEGKDHKITSPIKKTIKEFAGKFKNPKELTDYVNKTHKIAASYQQIYYHKSKLYAEKYG